MTERLPIATEEEVVEYARGIVTGDLMVADLKQHEWVHSLALMIPELKKIENLALILVPMGPHHSTHWINGIAPGLTFEVKLVPAENMERLCELADGMWLALHPEAKSDTDAE